MSLLPSDYETGTWERFRLELTERLEILRKRNDGDLGARKTALLRGQIAEVKRLLSLPAQPPPRDE